MEGMVSGKAQKLEKHVKKLQIHHGWSQESEGVTDCEIFFLGLTFLKEHSGCSVDSGLEGAKGDTGNPGEGYYNDPAEDHGGLASGLGHNRQIPETIQEAEL